MLTWVRGSEYHVTSGSFTIGKYVVDGKPMYMLFKGPKPPHLWMSDNAQECKDVAEKMLEAKK